MPKFDWEKCCACHPPALNKCNPLIRYNGQGVSQDKPAALLLFRDAAAAGDAQALFNCGAIEFASIHAAHDDPSRDMLHDVIQCLRVHPLPPCCDILALQPILPFLSHPHSGCSRPRPCCRTSFHGSPDQSSAAIC